MHTVCHGCMRWLYAMAWLLGAACFAMASDMPFRVGVAPHTSARLILQQYQPLRASLEKGLGQPVEIATAPDFTDFARRALRGEYDLAITTGHQALLLRDDAHYLPLVTYRAPFQAVVVGLASMPAGSSAAQLNGKTVLGLSPSSLVTLWGIHWLEQNKVKPQRMQFISAADSMAQFVIQHDAVVGFMSQANYEKLSAETRAQLRVVARSPEMAGRIYLLHPRLASRQAQLMRLIQQFGQSAEGMQYFQENKLDGYRLLKPGELEVMRPYADEVRRTLATQPGH